MMMNDMTDGAGPQTPPRARAPMPHVPAIETPEGSLVRRGAREGGAAADGRLLDWSGGSLGLARLSRFPPQKLRDGREMPKFARKLRLGLGACIDV